MNIGRLALCIDELPSSRFGRSEQPQVPRHNGESTIRGSRKAVAEKGVSHRQMDLLIRQHRILDELLGSSAAAVDRIARLTPRERAIMAMIVAGQPNKNIAADLDVSRRTIENHRAAIMKKTGAKSLPALVRLALAAAWIEDLGP